MDGIDCIVLFMVEIGYFAVLIICEFRRHPSSCVIVLRAGAHLAAWRAATNGIRG
jgi:hypothetical protein